MTMSRSFWSAAIRVGKVAIPVGLVPAIDPKTVTLRRLHRDCKHPFGSRAWCDHCGRLVPDEEIARGARLATGQHVLVDQEELAALAPEDTHTIETMCACAASLIDPALHSATYLLAPAEAPVARRPYELIRRALTDSDGLVLLARTVVRGHEWVCQVRADGKLLMLDRLHPVEDLADRAPLERLLTGVQVTEEEQQLAGQLVRELVPMRPRPASVLKLPGRARLRRLVDQKLAGEPVQIAAPAGPKRPTPEPLTAPDLADTLRRSLPRTRGKHAKRERRPAPATVNR